MSPTSYLAAPPRVKDERQTLSNDSGFVNTLPQLINHKNQIGEHKKHKSFLCLLCFSMEFLW
jgi:hypothetical protein